MIGIGFAERLAGGHHRPGELAPDRPFALDIVARPVRDSWCVSGTVRASSITEAALVEGRITRDGEFCVSAVRWGWLRLEQVPLEQVPATCRGDQVEQVPATCRGGAPRLQRFQSSSTQPHIFFISTQLAPSRVDVHA